MDLSLRNSTPSSSPTPVVSQMSGGIVKPIPRPPWSIVWYQNLWSNSSSLIRNETKVDSTDSMGLPLSILNCLRGSNSNQATENSGNAVASSYNFSFTPLTLSQQQNQERIFQNIGGVCQTSSLAFNHDPMSQSKNAQNFFPEKDRENVAISERSGDCSSDASISVRGENTNDETGNESENSENIVLTSAKERDDSRRSHHESGSLMESHQSNAPVLDIACCDGPVQFKRISNPNFAVTVEHSEICASSISPVPPANLSVSSSSSKVYRKDRGEPRKSQFTSSDEYSVSGSRRDEGQGRTATLKAYLCIYCNQSFKSLFCYQKHKKRHLNPVSVDITTTAMENLTSEQRKESCSGGVGSSRRNGGGGIIVGEGSSTTSSSCSRTTSSCRKTNNNGKRTVIGGGLDNSGGRTVGIIPESTKAKTKDLNVQFFPCKKCGSKFPSYYFVHKHRKICH